MATLSYLGGITRRAGISFITDYPSAVAEAWFLNTQRYKLSLPYDYSPCYNWGYTTHNGAYC
jgi:hypothetical protein